MPFNLNLRLLVLSLLFTLSACSGGGGSSNDNDSNDAPEIIAYSLVTEYETAVDQLFEGTDNDSDALTYSITTTPANGTATIDGDILTYTPATGFSGEDTLSYIANDGEDDSATAVITIIVSGAIIGEGKLTPAISGIEFESGSTVGLTDSNGQFSYEEGQTVTFKLGDLELGTIDGTTDGASLANIVGAESSDTYNQTLVNALRLIMEMDSDDNVFDGINIDVDTSSLPAGTIDSVDLTSLFERVGSAKVYAWLDYQTRHDFPEVIAANHHTLGRTSAGRGFSFGESYGGFVSGEDPNQYCETVLRLKLGRDYSEELAPGEELYTDDRAGVTDEENVCYKAFRNNVNYANYNPVAAWLNMEEDIVISSISTDQTDGAIVTDAGELYMFGPNNSGQGGDGTTNSIDYPTLIALPDNQKALYATTGSASSYVITEQGKIYASGDNGNLQLGQSEDTTADQSTFGLVNLPDDEYFVGVAIRDHHVYALTQWGDVYSWGNNGSAGELGTGTVSDDRALPVKIIENKDIINVETGADFGLAVDSVGVVYGWGNNSFGALAQGTPTTTGSVYKIEDIPEILIPTEIEALSANQLGDRIIRFQGGSRNAHALTAGGDVYSWGDRGDGYFGNGFVADDTITSFDRVIVLVPEKVADLDDVNIVRFSSNTTSHFAVAEDTTVYAWGSTADGRLSVAQGYCADDVTVSGTVIEGADSNVCYRPFKTTIDLGGADSSNYTILVAAGGAHTVAYTNGILYTWGRNTNGQLGNNDLGVDAYTPVRIGLPFDSQIIDIKANSNITLVLDENGDVWTWGSNSNGQVGNNSEADQAVMQKVAALDDVEIIDIGVGQRHGLAVTSTGDVWAWGDNAAGQLGYVTVDSISGVPVQIDSLTNIVDVEGGGSFSVAINASGDIYSWGSNDSGQLALDPTVTEFTVIPTLVEGVTNIDQVALGKDHVIALNGSGELYSWGQNFSGQLGIGSSDDSTFIPTLVDSLTGADSIAASGNFSLAITNGELYTWGQNLLGSLGTGLADDETTPTLVTALSNVTTAVNGLGHTIVVTQEGEIETFWTFGLNSFGQIGVVDAPFENLSPLEVTFD